jgi:hypothetical protein
MTHAHHRLPSQSSGAETGRNWQAVVRPVHLETHDLKCLFAARFDNAVIGARVSIPNHVFDWAQQVPSDVWKDRCLP